MKSGKLRHRITLQEAIERRDAYGASSMQWMDFATVWASVDPLSGRELFTAQQVEARTTGTIGIRFLPGVTAKMRVVFGTRIFEITSIINPGERDRELNLMVFEVIE